MSKKVTINDAAHEWVREMNAYPQDMIAALMTAYPNDWGEVTMPSLYDRVYIYDEDERGEIIGIDENVYTIELYSGKSAEYTEDSFDVEYDGVLPMWGAMWSVSDSADIYWLEELDGIKCLSECGFRVYEHTEWGYFFGIDGAGYSFYNAHWIPLYKARGLKWHTEEE